MQIDWWTLGIQTINFLIVIWLLSRFLYQPVRRIIEQRETEDRKLAVEAQAKAAAADAARQEYEDKSAALSAAQRQREMQLHAEMEKERDAALNDAKAASDKLMSDTRQRLDREREETLKGLKAEIANLAADLARKALDSGTSEQDVLSKTTEHLDRLSSNEMADLTKDVGGPEARLAIVTAAPLGDAFQSEWRSQLAERFGSGVQVEFDADPEILGGTVLHFPHAVLDLSVAQRLRDAVQAMKA